MPRTPKAKTQQPVRALPPPDPQTYELNRARRLDWKMIERLAAAGLTDRELEYILRLPHGQISNVRATGRGEALRSALDNGRKAATAHVEAALYNRAVGYTYTEEQSELVGVRRAGSGKPTISEADAVQPVMMVTRVTRKQAIPDVLAQIFYLKNRAPDRWRDVQGLDVRALVQVRELAGRSPDELKALAEEIRARRALLAEAPPPDQPAPPADPPA